ncbi:MAG: glycoside hydrolase family 3 C-terminal domain-containing protein [Acetatifactor sp.]|nr:glycoside hydrolase family 3 C-terminal domain-containing protein [Acetatifactor sp.]
MQRWARALYQPMLPLGKDGRRITASKEHIFLSKEAAKEGMVLLKNDDSVLPLARGSKVALFGKASFDYVKGGGGSGDVTVSYTRNLYEGLKEKSDHVTVFEELSAFYRENVREQYAKGSVPGLTVEPEIPAALLKKARAFTDTAIIAISRFSGEGWDRSVQSSDRKLVHVEDRNLYEKAEKIFERGDFYLSRGEEAMVYAVKKAFPKVIVVMNAGGMTDSSWFAEDGEIQSFLMAWQGGMEGGLAAAELLVGEGNPSGKLTDTFARRLEDYPSSDNFHESEDYVDYTDDIYVGYRYFETIPEAADKVNYPFGYGLSYTQFSLGKPLADRKEDRIEITVSVSNTGNVSGKEVVQVYFSAPQGKLGKPARELIAFGKSRLLAPGETQTMILRFRIDDMASYDDLGKIAGAAYVLERGVYSFYVGTSVRDAVAAEFRVEIPEDVIVEQLTNRMVPTSLKKRMCADGSYEELPMSEPFDTDANALEPLSDRAAGFAPAVKGHDRFRLWGEEKKVHTFDEVAEGRVSMGEFMAQFSNEQLADLLGGQPNTGVADVFGYGNVPEYGVPNVMTADGPAGLRIRPERGVYTTAWPCATLLACTWNPELTEQIGAAGGAEVKENNIALWLTPAINIHRSPLCGRNFEYYSEDPFLTGKMAAAMVRGIQSNRVGAAVKHFALNNKETNRKNSDSRASERAIREIYLRAFEIVVREADPWCIMSSYNIINGHRASENRELLEDILRGEWGFKGMVTTDWWTAGEHYKETKAGNDAKMGCGFPERLLEAVGKGVLSREEMEICAERILEMILKVD